MKRTSLYTAAATLLALTVGSLALVAQDLHPSRRPSPMGMARILLGDTYLRVVYNRPYKRDRDNIFGSAESGALVPYDKLWRTGANEAPELTVTSDVRLGGKTLPAGTYTLLTTPSEKEWTIHLLSALGLSGAGRFDPESERMIPVSIPDHEVVAVRVPVSPPLEEEVDQFTISFERADRGTELILRWIKTEVRVPIEVVS